MSTLAAALSDPIYLHVVLVHVPIVGLAISTLLLVGGLLARHRLTIRYGLIAAVLFSAPTGLIMGSGEEAEEALQNLPSVELSETDESWITHHDERAHSWGKTGYACLALAALGLVAGFVQRRFLYPAAFVVAIVCIVTVFALRYVGQAGYGIRHPELRGIAANLPPSDGPAAAGRATPSDEVEHGPIGVSEERREDYHEDDH